MISDNNAQDQKTWSMLLSYLICEIEKVIIEI